MAQRYARDKAGRKEESRREVDGAYDSRQGGGVELWVLLQRSAALVSGVRPQLGNTVGIREKRERRKELREKRVPLPGAAGKGRGRRHQIMGVAPAAQGEGRRGGEDRLDRRMLTPRAIGQEKNHKMENLGHPQIMWGGSGEI